LCYHNFLVTWELSFPAIRVSNKATILNSLATQSYTTCRSNCICRLSIMSYMYVPYYLPFFEIHNSPTSFFFHPVWKVANLLLVVCYIEFLQCRVDMAMIEKQLLIRNMLSCRFMRVIQIPFVRTSLLRHNNDNNFQLILLNNIKT
jgi:hypothetical protein